MTKYSKNISSAKTGLHMKVTVDNTETVKYVKQLGPAGAVVLTKHLKRSMEEVREKTRRELYANKSYTIAGPSPVKWRSSASQMRSGNLRSFGGALAKIADSLVVAETSFDKGRFFDKHSASISMWSQDPQSRGNFTAAGVRGSRGGKIAQYYESGMPPFDITIGDSSFKHVGFKKIGYMAKAKARVEASVRKNLDAVLHQNLKPGATYTSSRPAQMKKSDMMKGMAALKHYGERSIISSASRYR